MAMQTEKTAEERLAAILKEAVMDATDGDTEIRISPSSYDDIISEDSILDAYHKYCKRGRSEENESFGVYLEQFLYEKFFIEQESDVMSELFDQVRAYVEAEIDDDDEMTAAWEKLTADSFMGDILEMGGLVGGIYFDFDAFLDNNTYYVNLMFAGEKEQNLDMGSISTFFDDITEFDNVDEFEEYQDNALSYLIRQQGYTNADVFEAIRADADSNNEFIKSVVAELDELTYSMSEMTLCTSCGGVQLVELLDKITKGEGYIEFSKETETGLFNEWEGTGSLLEIALEKPAVFPVSMVRNIQLEGASGNYGYTVDDVYSMIGKTWEKSSIEFTDTPPVLCQEDLKATYNRFISNGEQEKSKPTPSVERD